MFVPPGEEMYKNRIQERRASRRIAKRRGNVVSRDASFAIQNDGFRGENLSRFPSRVSHWPMALAREKVEGKDPLANAARRNILQREFLEYPRIRGNFSGQGPARILFVFRATGAFSAARETPDAFIPASRRHRRRIGRIFHGTKIGSHRD